MNNSEKAYQYLIDNGIKPHHAAGLVGNLMQESYGLDKIWADGKIDSKGSKGIMQWHGPRLMSLYNFQKEKDPNYVNGNPISLTDQLDFILHESKTGNGDKWLKKQYDKAFNTSNIEEATMSFSNDVIRPSKKHANNNKRIEFANSLSFKPIKKDDIVISYKDFLDENLLEQPKDNIPEIKDPEFIKKEVNLEPSSIEQTTEPLPQILTPKQQIKKSPNKTSYTDFIQQYLDYMGNNSKAKGGYIEECKCGCEGKPPCPETGKETPNILKNWFYNNEEVRDSYQMANEYDNSWLKNWLNSKESISRYKNMISKMEPGNPAEIDKISFDDLNIANYNMSSLPLYDGKKLKNIDDSDLFFNHNFQNFFNSNKKGFTKEFLSQIRKGPSVSGRLANAWYNPNLHSISTDPEADNNIPRMTHEITHGLGNYDSKTDNFILNNYKKKNKNVDDYIINEIIKKNWGITENLDEQLKKFKEDNPELTKQYKEYIDYLNSDGIYPRIMQLRRMLNLKPNDKLKKGDLDKKELKEDKNGLLRSLEFLYDKDTIIKIMNEVASNNHISNSNIAAYGGKFDSKINISDKLNEFNEGGSHEQNPLGGIPQGIGTNGKMNTVEEGETSFNFDDGKYIFSDRIKLDGSGFKKTDDNTFANGGQECGKPGQPPCPSSKDSLSLYNNTMKFIKKLNDKNYIKIEDFNKDVSEYLKFNKDGSIDISEQNKKDLYNHEEDGFFKLYGGDRILKNNNNYKLNPNIPRTGEKRNDISDIANPISDYGDFYYIKEKDKYKYDISELSSPYGYNTDLPTIELDGRIEPKKLSRYILRPSDSISGDFVEFPLYDPILIKPADMLTPEERKERIKKYGDKAFTKPSKKPEAKEVNKLNKKDLKRIKPEFNFEIGELETPFEIDFYDTEGTSTMSSGYGKRVSKRKVFDNKELDKLKKQYNVKGSKLKITPRYRRKKK